MSAQADNALSRALHDRKVTVKKLEILHDFRRVGRQNLHHQIRNIQSRIARAKANGPALASDRQRFSRNERHLAKLRRELRQRLHKLERNVRHRTLVLRSRRMDLSTWIKTYGIFRYCPVRGPVDVSNNFGYAVPQAPGHAGAHPSGQRHDGRAAASRSWRRSTGSRRHRATGSAATRSTSAVAAGFVYNAHLSAYGKLGKVKAGDVIGYVGIHRKRRRPARPLRVAPGQRQRGGPVPLPDGGLLVRLTVQSRGIIDRSH